MIVLGMSAVFIRMADAPGIITAFYRMSIGSIIVFPFLITVQKKSEKINVKGLGYGVIGGLLFGLDLVLWSTGIQMSGATAPTLMANTAPVWVGLGTMLIYRIDLDRKYWSGLLIAMVGAIIVLGFDWNYEFQTGIGTLLGLLAAVFYGGYYLVTQKGRLYLSTLQYFFVTTTTSAIVLLIANIVVKNKFSGFSKETIIIFAMVGILVQVIGWLLINYAQGILPASIVAPTLLGQPVMTGIFSWWLIGEKLNWGHLIGGAAVLVGIFLVNRSRRTANYTGVQK